jgi:hypothetical protein
MWEFHVPKPLQKRILETIGNGRFVERGKMMQRGDF